MSNRNSAQQAKVENLREQLTIIDDELRRSMIAENSRDEQMYREARDQLSIQLSDALMGR